jgi:UDP-2-acetamido-3-amino-2,3-dideoxy-glucuronate N-acetyltransferase
MEKQGNKKNVAVVGCGKWGKNLARNFHQLGTLHTICDANESLLDKFQSQYPDVKSTSNYTSVLEDNAITRIVIAAPSFKHFELAKQALRVGKDVYVEKPLCMNSHEAEELILLAEDRKLILMVGHLLHYHPCLRRLQELTDGGELGKVQYIVSNRLNLGALRLEENALWDLAPHDVSVILALCGQRMPVQVRCTGEALISEGIADTALISLKFEGGVSAHIYASRVNPYKEQKLTVVGSQGMAVFDDTSAWENKLLLYRNPLNWPEGSSMPVINNITPEKVNVPQSEPLRTECEHFIQCCEKRMKPKTDGQEGLRVLKVLQAAQASLVTDGERINPEQYHFFEDGKSQSLILT